MASCIDTINADIASDAWMNWVAITPSLPVFVENYATTKFIMSLSTNKSESIVFNFNCLTPAGRSYTISIFKLVSASGSMSANSVGSITSSDQSLTFQKDFSPGDYAICFSSLAWVQGELRAQFAGFVNEIRFFPRAYTGDSCVSSLRTITGVLDTKLPRIYTLIDGELPPGYVLQTDGSIRGLIDNLDAVTETEYAPSINWFYSDQDVRTRSLPRRWTFKARVELRDFPEAWDEEWFSIEIHNNWDKDKAAFEKDGGDFDKEYETVEYIEVENPVKAELCCPASQTIPALPAVSLAPIPTQAPVVQPTEFDKVVSEFGSSDNEFIRAFVTKLKKTDKYTQTQNVQTFEEIVFDPEERKANHVDAIVLEINNEHKSEHMPLLAIMFGGESFLAGTLE